MTWPRVATSEKSFPWPLLFCDPIPLPTPHGRCEKPGGFSGRGSPRPQRCFSPLRLETLCLVPSSRPGVPWSQWGLSCGAGFGWASILAPSSSISSRPTNSLKAGCGLTCFNCLRQRFSRVSGGEGRSSSLKEALPLSQPPCQASNHA